MSENKDYITRYEANGTVNISAEVICSIAALAACEVEGVCGLSQNRSAEIAELLGYKSLAQGVHLSAQEDQYQVECNVVLEQGCQFPTVAAEIQKAVASAIESTTGIQISAVNVNICSVALPKKTV